jgi:hypothetical protein
LAALNKELKEVWMGFQATVLHFLYHLFQFLPLRLAQQGDRRALDCGIPACTTFVESRLGTSPMRCDASTFRCLPNPPAR